MASPPLTYSPTALSPPASSRSQLPPINTMTGKRKPTDGAGAPALKRRKASTMSVTSGAGSAHPLRQTSFPPDEFGIGTPTDARSPSVDLDSMSFVSGSQVSMAAAPVKKKRGRKSKAEKALQREQTPSVAGGKAPSAVGGVSDAGGRGGKSGAGAGGEDGDGDDEGPTEVAATGTTMTKEQKEEEHRARGMLINAFSPEQFDRFENWRAANFSKAGVRRLVNATISQSVTENVVIGMRAVAKVYIGDIIEAARRVQMEWVENTGEKQTDLPTPPASAMASPIEGAEGQPAEPPKDDRLGPLRPEHLREAVRRYKRSFEGGGVGMQRVWHQQQQNGTERFPPRTGGRRIFR
ncbi:hTAFII28-like protein conserved region-domain-containing protein [Cercophora newfieldiana]|uniref:HTAFII28-like protein conserved region-domain-containing protein n=1 Tax=Cercophora newfieldiana TaxID=92897 RepID=A0AA39XSK9_9PEZI|nr:hTAFII28-like protein conserved region-domain-containing protein [Cercophora newfieldiana]